MRPIRTVRAGIPAPFVSLGHLLSSHQAITRVGVAAILFTAVVAFSQQAPTQATPQASAPIPQSLLPQTIGVAVATDDAVDLTFEEPMDRASVEAAFELAPDGGATLRWNADHTRLSVEPERLWRTDEVYSIVIGASATTAAGEALLAPQRYAFSTQTAPVLSTFEVDLAAGTLASGQPTEAELAVLDTEHPASEQTSFTTSDTAREVHPSTAVRISFSGSMDRRSVEESFAITPAVPGELSWSAGDLVFTPSERLELGARYTISVIGARDRTGNELGGKANFSFVVRAAPQVTRTTPELDASGVEPGTVEMWFSHPMNVDATNAAFGLTDTTTGQLVPGVLNWNESATQIVYSPDRPLAGSRTFTVTLGAGAADADGNPITVEWSFTTAARAAPAAQPAASGGAAPRPSIPVPVMGESGLEGYAMAQINGARAAYGLPPLAYDPAISAVASAHAWDQLVNGYYSHNSLNGATVHMRLAAAGIGFSAAGENACHSMTGAGPQGTMDWCHGVFMSEPCCGYANHIGNILGTRYTRVGVGVAFNGSRVVIVWDFAN